MKLKSIFLYIILITLFSCSKDETIMMVKSDATPPKITGPVSGLSKVIMPDNLTETIDFKWDNADYGVNTQVTYTVQIDSKCNSFANPVVIGTSSTNSLSVTLDNLNSALLNSLKTAPLRPAELQLRVTAVLNNKLQTISESVPLTITPWGDRPMALWLGENPTAASIFATSPSTYEGYRYIKAGTFQFSDNPVCADSIFGSSEAGKLIEGSTSTGIVVSKSGYYKVNVDTKNLTYDTVAIKTWGMVGSATTGDDSGWNNSVPMTYNTTKDIWEGTIDLKAGALKFRANDAWDINYGPADPSKLVGTLTGTNDAITITAAGNYTVIADFSKAGSDNYTYSVTKNIVTGPVTTYLYIAGDFQGWNIGVNPGKIASVNDDGIYEGYIYIPGGTREFKLYAQQDWAPMSWGDGGNGDLIVANCACSNWVAPSNGYYWFAVNLNTMKYDLIKTDWGIIGDATPAGWPASTPMTYNPDTKVWTITANLIPGALKFRANDAWDIQFGDLDGNLAYADHLMMDYVDLPAFTISAAGNYTITLDLHISGNYSYKIELN